MNFEEEAFISYAHLDNQEVIEGRKGWVSDFHRALKIRLGELLGKDPRIWRDPKLQGNDIFTETLSERLQNVAAFLPVLSPRYMKSEWTLRELSDFWAAAQSSTGVRVGDKSRIFKILKTRIPLEQHPPELQSLLGYEFFKVDEETGRIRELSELFGPELQGEFWLKIGDLAHDLCDLLQELECGEFGTAESKTPPAPDKSQPAAYLAETTRDQSDAYNAVRRDLKQHSQNVMPLRPLPTIPAELESFLPQQLDQCRVSVHLIGKNYGTVPEGWTESLPEIQNRLAAVRAAKGNFARLVWIPPGIQVDDERQRNFINRLRMDTTFQNGSDLLETPLEKLQAIVFDRLKPAPAVELRPESTNQTPSRSSVPRVYFIFDQRDQESVQPWSDFLFDQGCEVLRSEFEGTEAQIREYHEDSLRTCDAALIHYGEGNECWLRRQLREIQKAPGYGRTVPMRAVAITLAPPKTSSKLTFRTHDAIVLPQHDGLAPDILRPFIESLKTAAEKEAVANGG